MVLIQIARMKCNNINNINKEAPITYKIRINQPLFLFDLNLSIIDRMQPVFNDFELI